MPIDDLKPIAEEALAFGAALGFDYLRISAVCSRTLCVRVTQSRVSRENSLTDRQHFSVEGIWSGRRSGFEVSATTATALAKQLTRLRSQLERQSQERDLVVPLTPTGRFQWHATRGRLASPDELEALYSVIARQADRVACRGRRLTGFIEGAERAEDVLTLNGLDLSTRSLGVTATMTVDAGDSSQVGATERASTGATLHDLERVITDAVGEALELSEASAICGDVEPGEYTVVLHPVAVRELVATAIAYGLFDEQRVADGHTYLSGAIEKCAFPEGLVLRQAMSLVLPSGEVYSELPLNQRFVQATGVELVSHGRIREMLRSPLWARKTGREETFGPTSGPPLLLEARPGTALAGQHQTISDLIGDTKRGLLVANLWYVRMVAEMDGILTGVTSDGLFEIVEGRVVRALHHMRWHDNPIRMLAAISGLTEQKLLLGRSRLSGPGRAPMALMPAVRVEGVRFTSTTAEMIS